MLRGQRTPSPGTPQELVGDQVDDDAVDPRGEPALATEGVELAQDSGECLLREVLGQCLRVVRAERLERVSLTSQIRQRRAYEEVVQLPGGCLPLRAAGPEPRHQVLGTTLDHVSGTLLSNASSGF